MINPSLDYKIGENDKIADVSKKGQKKKKNYLTPIPPRIEKEEFWGILSIFLEHFSLFFLLNSLPIHTKTIDFSFFLHIKR